MWGPAHTVSGCATGSGAKRPPADQQGAAQREQQMDHTGFGSQDKGQYDPENQRDQGDQQGRKLHANVSGNRLTVEERVSILMPGER